ncbi:hypothetical protein KIN20_011833 [Parelaphostrongylus tenuis]|uniref:Uncharacterized protein n=1 Tax=Parelaphostrongylus tenuis TaxID=148309 RepID=A0AAD5MVK5_PARTN|nr:hypothetical protein KIN20_011833 [Parelaphostrongylus tenuis]
MEKGGLTPKRYRTKMGSERPESIDGVTNRSTNSHIKIIKPTTKLPARSICQPNHPHRAQFYRTGVYGGGSPYYPPGRYYYYIYYPYSPFNQQRPRRGGLGRFWRRLLKGAVVGGLLGFLAGKK